MPEGPEVRREADAIGEAIAGRQTREVEFAIARLKPFEERLSGRVVEDVTSRGKAMLVRFDHGLTLYSHNQLYGKWMVRAGDTPPSTGRSLRVAIRTDTHSALLYSATDVDVLTNDELAEHPYLSKLGPDILATTLRPAVIARRLSQDRFRNRTLGTLLLDQGFLAGVGNYLRSEILFEARLHPGLRPRDLTDAQRQELGSAVRKVSRRAYQNRGVTVAAQEFDRYKKRGEDRRQARFSVYSRSGRACRSCGSLIERLPVAGRRLYLCPRCQGNLVDV